MKDKARSEEPSGGSADRSVNTAAILTGVLGVAWGLVPLTFPLSLGMAFGATVSFVSLGLGFIAMGLGWRVTARALMSTAGLLDLTLSVAYIAGVGLDSRLLIAALPGAPINYYSMNSNAAFGCALVAAAALLLTARRESLWRSMTVVLCASGTVALGVYGLAGRLTGFQSSYAVERLTGMVPPVATGLIFLGAGVLAVSWRASRDIPTDRTSWILIVVAMTGIVISTSLWQALILMENVHIESPLQLRSYLAGAVLVLGLLATALLVSAVYLVQTTRRRAQRSELLRTKAEESLQALAESERKYRAVAESLPQRIAHKDQNSVYLSCNQNFASHLGISPQAVAGKSDFDLFPREMAEKHRAEDQRVVESAEAIEAEEEDVGEGQARWVHRVNTPVRDESGTVVGLISMVWDITDRKRAEEELGQKVKELARSNEELAQFAYVASHDLQEPLRKIVAFGDRLAAHSAGALDEQGRDFLARMQKAAERMASLIESLLMLSRVTSRAEEFQAVDLNRVVSDVLNDLEAHIQETGGLVKVEPLPTLLADPFQLRQLFQNLIWNALKFHKPNLAPVVHVSARRRGQIWEIHVEDNGIGFEQRYAERIFRPFQRLHGRGEYPGTGMGLTICSKIATRHSGEIRVQSQVGEGSDFVLILPAMTIARKAKAS